MEKMIFCTLMFFAVQVCAQDSLTPTPEQIKAYKKNQYTLDKNHGGIGPVFFKPNLGKGVSSNMWYGVDMLTDIFHVRLAFGEVGKYIPKEFATGEINTAVAPLYGTDKSYNFYLGVNVPLNLLNFGAQRSYKSVLRGHPTLGGGLGVFKMGRKLTKSDIYYLGISPGYRVRFPFASLEFNLDTYFGIVSQSSPDFYRGVGFHPSLTLRIDALKGLFNPNMISVAAQQVSVSNVQSDTRKTGSRYTQTGGRVDYYETTTTADVNVTNMNIGVQDIGPHVGIGPKYSFNTPRQTDYTNRGFLAGVAMEGRASSFDFGLTIEGGKVGHGSALEDKSDNKYRRKLNRGQSRPVGTVNMANLYLNLGIDISQIFLIPTGIVLDKGNATSFFSATAGINVGMHHAFNQQYDPGVTEGFTGLPPDEPEAVKTKFLDPSEVGFGYLGGFYMSVQIGAMSFKITNYRYYGAPFASTTMYGIVYRIPLDKMRN